MFSVGEFIMTERELSDRDLFELIRGQMLADSPRGQREWLRQTELALSACGSPAQRSAATRVRAVLKKLEGEFLRMPTSWRK
jgi:hypothetical protein